MKHFGYEDESHQIVVETNEIRNPSDLIFYEDNKEIMRKSAIEMQYERPTPHHIAKADGTWQISDKLLIQEIQLKRNSLLELARNKINDLQIIVDMKTHNPDDDTPQKQFLTAWKQYLVDLYEIEQQTGFPENIIWPTPPEMPTT